MVYCYYIILYYTYFVLTLYSVSELLQNTDFHIVHATLHISNLKSNEVQFVKCNKIND